jgi:hypothetical protein
MLKAEARQSAKKEAGKSKVDAGVATPQSAKPNLIWQQLATRVQPKLVVSVPDDPYEREADRVADRVMRMPEPTIQRSCAGCASGGKTCPKCAEEIREGQADIYRTAQDSDEAGMSVPDEFLSTLGPGQPLDRATRDFMEPRFGCDFSEVRVHADLQGATSARSINARAFALGQDIVFGPGGYAPQTQSGQRLLAHELTHVVQQNPSSDMKADIGAGEQILSGGNPGAVPGAIQRDEDVQVSTAPPAPPASAERTLSLLELHTQITEETARTTNLRTQLEALQQSSSERTRLETELDAARLRLISLLEQRSDLLRTEIASLQAQIGPTAASSAEHPERENLGNQLNSREQELLQHQNQLRSLIRWRTRRQIVAHQSEIEQIDRDLLALPPLRPEAPASEPSDPRALALISRRNELQQQQRNLAAQLASTAVLYSQRDPRWGHRRYGTSPSCTNIAQAGCGPTSLAILLNYLFQEDPEVAEGGNLEIVSPPATAAYAASHGRVCNDGTLVDTMVTNVPTQWPGFRGSRITLTEAASRLRSGDLIIFSCRSCAGQNAAGETHAYEKHIMVLNGVNDDASQFDVMDPAGHHFVRITRAELLAHTGGFWVVTRK